MNDYNNYNYGVIDTLYACGLITQAQREQALEALKVLENLYVPIESQVIGGATKIIGVKA